MRSYRINCLGQIASWCGLHRCADYIVRSHCADCIVQMASYGLLPRGIVSCGLHRADGIVWIAS